MAGRDWLGWRAIEASGSQIPKSPGLKKRSGRVKSSIETLEGKGNSQPKGLIFLEISYP